MTALNIHVKICKFIRNFRANLHEYFCKHYTMRHEPCLTDKGGHRQIADGLLCSVRFHVLFQHPIRSQTVEQHLPAHLPMRFLPFFLGGFRDAQLSKNLLCGEEVLRPFLRREFVQFLRFTEGVVELLPGSMSSRSTSAAAMPAAGWLRINSFTFIPHLPLEKCAIIAHVLPAVLTHSGGSRCPPRPM